MKTSCSRRGKLGRKCDGVVENLSKLRGKGGYNGTGWSVSFSGKPEKDQIIRAAREGIYLILHKQPSALILAAQNQRLEEDQLYQFLDVTVTEPPVPPWLSNALDELKALSVDE